MSLLPFDLTLTVGAALAVFVLGFMVWWRNKWSRGNVVFALMAFTLSLWTTVDWFHNLQLTALPEQIVTWRLLFYLGVALGPAFAMHTATIVARRPFKAMGWLCYLLSLSLFFVIDSAFVLRAIGPTGRLGNFLLEFGALFGLLYYVAAILVVSTLLYPTPYSETTDRLERRRSSYALLVIVFYLVAGMHQFVIGPVPTSILMTILAGGFFLLATMGFVRARLLDVDMTALEGFFLVLASGAVVNVLRSRETLEALVALLGTAVIALFGFMAVRTVRGESGKRWELERINEQLKALDESKSDLVALVAHQLRSPLGGIRFAADMLARGDYGALPERARDVTVLIRQSVDHLLALAKTSLNAARVEAGAFQVVPSVVDPAAETRSLIAEVEPFARAKGLRVTATFSGVPECILVDREILRNVTSNLIDNAVKYTDQGGVTVHGMMDGDRLVLTISDTGAGLTEEECAALFRRFRRGRAGKDRHEEGMGFGLYVVKRLVGAAGGTVSVTSMGPGKGSTFTFSLPVGRVDDRC